MSRLCRAGKGKMGLRSVKNTTKLVILPEIPSFSYLNAPCVAASLGWYPELLNSVAVGALILQAIENPCITHR